MCLLVFAFTVNDKEIGGLDMDELTAYVRSVTREDPFFLRDVEDTVVFRLSYHVKRLRRERRLTQRELADLLGVRQPFVARIESGRGNLSLRKVESVSRALEVDPQELLSPVFAYGRPEEVARLVVNRHYRILAANAGAERYLGKPVEELLDKPFPPHLPLRRDLEKVFHRGEAVTELDGGACRIRLILNRRGRPIGADITLYGIREEVEGDQDREGNNAAERSLDTAVRGVLS